MVELERLKTVYKQPQTSPFLSTLVLSVTLCLLLSACSLPHNIASILDFRRVEAATSSRATARQHLNKIEGMKQLQSLFGWLAELQRYGGNGAAYLPLYAEDQQALQQAQTVAQYDTFDTRLQSHIVTVQLAALKTEAQALYHRLDQAVIRYGQQHSYHDSENHLSYPYAYGYAHQKGILGPLWTLGDLQSAKTSDDYQQIIEELNTFSYNFQQMVLNSSKTTPGTMAHATDLALLNNYGDMHGQAIVVSLTEQMLRLYHDDQLIKAMPITSGQPDLPTPPGVWQITDKQQNITFHSSAAPGSDEWYPDTPIHDALAFHSGGYFIHDAWWRDKFGAGTEFPHDDPSGLEGSNRGSHGCINVSQDNAAWLDSHVNKATPVIIY